MQQRIWLVFAVVAGIGFGVQVSLPGDFSDWPETSFDTAPRGHAGVFALLDRFDATSGRWLSGVTHPAAKDTIWWIAPSGACEAVPTDESDESGESDESTSSSKPRKSSTTSEVAALPTAFEVTARPWIEAGGTAIVWLPHPPLPTRPPPPESGPSVGDEGRVEDGRSGVETLDGEAAAGEGAEEGAKENDALAVREQWEEDLARRRTETREGVARDCDAILGIALPPRALAGLEGGLPPEEGRYSPIVFSVGRATKRREDFDYEQTRTLPGGTLAFFQSIDAPAKEGAAVGVGGGDDEADLGRVSLQGWQPLWVEADEAMPLALERKVGEGLLIVIADARILSNDRLGHVDSAPFVFDWIRDHGHPWIDEHAHGVVPETGTFRYLAQSPAWAAGLGLLVMGVLVVWRGHAWPTRTVSEFDPDSPTLSTFVDSVARLYSRTRDHAQVFDRYRLLCLDRIRRALGLAPGTGVEVILASLRARAGNGPQLEEVGLRHLLIKQPSISSASDLARNVARLDELVRVLRDRGKRGGNGPNQVETSQRGPRGRKENL
jgi:hypothetical protein